MSKLIRVLRKIIALTEQETKEFIQDQKGNITQEKLQQFVNLKNLDEEGVKELIYDLDKHGIKGLQKPVPFTKLESYKRFAHREFKKIYPKSELIDLGWKLTNGFKASVNWLQDNGWAINKQSRNSYKIFDRDDAAWNKVGLKIVKNLYQVNVDLDLQGTLISNTIPLYITIEMLGDLAFEDSKMSEDEKKKTFLNLLPEIKKDVQEMENRIKRTVP
jgi:hypothetical protein